MQELSTELDYDPQLVCGLPGLWLNCRFLEQGLSHIATSEVGKPPNLLDKNRL